MGKRELDSECEAFVAETEPRLRRALIGAVGVDAAADATAEALVYAWVHWPRVSALDNPVGYLYRVAQSKARTPKQPLLTPPPTRVDPEPDFELREALLVLPVRQRSAVWLVHGCRWSYAEVADALGITVSTVGSHVARGLQALRARLDPPSSTPNPTKEAIHD